MSPRMLATVSPSIPGFVRQEINLSSGPASFSAYTQQIDKPLSDEREYKLIRLDNELEALLIHDPTTDKASAAMDVRVGHLSDPENLPGMAHFCEHLLFMGTKKYPRENEYSEFLANHSGSSNAFTALENTNYFFDVGHAHLEGALDRFAQFFLEPLFDPSCSEREIRAVDSEHKKNLQSDMWRSFQLEKSLCDPKHAYSKFGTGNLETLWTAPRSAGLDIRDELLKFHAQYYSANMMKLVVLGRESTDQLAKWVIEKFSHVQNKGFSVPRFPNSPLGEEQLRTQVVFRTIKDVRLLDITFPFPEQTYLFQTKPGQLLSYFIGHEGHGSLLSCLKQAGWANMLSAGSTLAAEGFELFKISVDLTQQGYEHYEQVIAAVFQYLNLLRETPIEEWMFKEVQQLSELRFAFKEKGSPSLYCSTLAGQMQAPYPPQWLLSGPYLLHEFDPKLVSETLDTLRPDSCRVMLAGKEPPAGVTLDCTERWYGTEYTVVPLSAQGGSPLDGLALPKRNEFVPSNLDILSKASEVEKPTERPQLLVDTDTVRLWHKQDDRFFLPKANVMLLLRSPQVNESPYTAAQSRLLVELVKDALTEYSYDAEVAGLLYNIDCQLDGIDIAVGGYNDKLAKLLEAVINTVSNLSVDAKRYEMIKDQVRRSYENFDQEAPYQHAIYYSTILLTERVWTQHEKLAILDQVKLEDVLAFAKRLLSQMHLEMLVHGNMSSEQAASLANGVEKLLSFKALPPAQRLPPNSLLLPQGSNYSWTYNVANPSNVNSSLEYFVQVGHPTDVRSRSTLALLAQIAQEPCFDQLRTKEQLGYLVFSGVRKAVGLSGFRVIVQSERDARYLESRIDSFFDNLVGIVERMTPTEFEAHRASLIHKLMESAKNLSEETNRFWLSIHSGYYDFAHRSRDAAMLRALTKDDVLKMLRTKVHPSSTERAKLVVRLESQVTTTPFSAAAWDAFDAFLAANGVSVPAEAHAAVRSQAHSVQAVKQFVKQSNAQAGWLTSISEDQVFSAIDRFAAEHPVKDDTVTPPPPSALKEQEITDVPAFKASLRVSDSALPIQPLTELASDPRHDAPIADSIDATPSVRANI
ncbi:insulysin [Malassezia cuniculi]|uniref:Insulysin n=1 Tax=Malassezia cuniculi TaxID=948313 RepID=A0AAF0J615_9BASI|nr:insulysin [Malassezia cuniculi]